MIYTLVYAEVLLLFAVVVYFGLSIRPGKRILIDERPRKDGRLRSLGLMERWYSASHDSKIFIKFSIAIQMEGKPPTVQSMEEAMSLLMEKHTLLSVSLVDNEYKTSSDPYFKLVDTSGTFVLPIENILRTDSEQWKKIVDFEQHTPFNTKDPNSLLWKIIVLSSQSNSFELIFAFHHAIADGMSASVVVTEFLDALRKGAKGTRKPKSSQLSPPLDNVLDIRPPIGHIVTALLHDKIPALNPVLTAFLGPPHIEKPRKMCQAFLTLGEGEVISINEAAKRHNTTFHGAICAASHFALAKTGKELSKQKKIKTYIVSALNLRPLCKPALKNDVIGPYVCGPGGVHTISDSTSFWTLAKECRDEIIENTQKSYQTIGILKFLSGSWKDFFHRKETQKPNGRNETLHLSNLGRVTFPESSEWKIKNSWFINSKTPEGPLYMIASMTTNGKFTCHVSAPYPLVNEATVEEYSKNLNESLLRAMLEDQLFLGQFCS